MPVVACPCVCGCSAMAGVGYKSITWQGAVNDGSTEFGVLQQIIDRMLVTNGIWSAVKQKWRAYTIPPNRTQCRW